MKSKSSRLYTIEKKERTVYDAGVIDKCLGLFRESGSKRMGNTIIP
jgi:hypothetical protein